MTEMTQAQEIAQELNLPRSEYAVRHDRRFRGLHKFFEDPKALVGAVILGIFIVLAVFAPLIAPEGINDQDPSRSMFSPSLDHPMGTDRLGRDVLSRVIYGSRISVTVGIIAVGIAAGIGVPLGLLAGYSRGWIDEVLMRFVDAWIAFPGLILTMAIVAIIGPGVVNVMIAIGLSSFPVYARLIRGQTLSMREREFVFAARSLGASNLRIVAQHILPNTIQPVIVQASLLIGSAILAEAGLSFLGIGIEPPQPTWGAIISGGFPLITINPWPAILPGVCLFLFVLSTSFLGDRLRDVLDPRLRGLR